MRGKLYIVGAGPGDPGLLTLRAYELLRSADVVLYDRLVSPEILELVNPGAELVYVGKRIGEQERKQALIYRLVEKFLSQGRDVVRLKGGDPFIFGRGAEELLRFTDLGYEVEVVPGISSCIGVPELAGIPLTLRGCSSSFAVVAGNREDTDWSLYSGVDTLVILMGVTGRERIAKKLIESGRDPSEPVAFVEKGTWREERVVIATLRETAEGLVDVKPPAVFVVGRVVSFTHRLRKLKEVAACLNPTVES